MRRLFLMASISKKTKRHIGRMPIISALSGNPAAGEVSDIYATANGNLQYRDSTGVDRSIVVTDDDGRVTIGANPGTRRLLVADDTGQVVTTRLSGVGTGCYIEFKDATTSADFKVRVGAIGDELLLFAGGTEQARLSSTEFSVAGDVVADQVTYRGGVGNGRIYADANGELHAVDKDGNATQLTSHPTDAPGICYGQAEYQQPGRIAIGRQIRPFEATIVWNPHAGPLDGQQVVETFAEYQERLGLSGSEMAERGMVARDREAEESDSAERFSLYQSQLAAWLRTHPAVRGRRPVRPEA